MEHKHPRPGGLGQGPGHGGALMEHLHGWFVAAAYAIALVILLADAFLPRIKFKSLLRGILLRERRASASKNESP